VIMKKKKTTFGVASFFHFGAKCVLVPTGHQLLSIVDGLNVIVLCYGPNYLNSKLHF
jgi:hypothetical protein